MLHGKQSDRMNSSRLNHFVSYKELSPTSTLSSGYSSGCAESDIDDMLYSTGATTINTPPQQEESEYFELESDQYICLGGPSCLGRTSAPADGDDIKLQKVRNSMMRIIEDLESLGYETNLDRLSDAVCNSVRLSKINNTCSKSQKTSTKRKSHTNASFQNNNNNNVYTKSPVDQLFTEMGQYHDSSSKEKLYDSLITKLAIECSVEEPIYEEIGDDSDFDFVSHSDTYRKANVAPALPPRSTRSLESRKARHSEHTRRVSTPCLTEVQKISWRSPSWQAMSV